MMKYLLIAAGFALSFFLIVKREQIGDSIGEADWMRYVGGVYNLLVIVAVILFFWCLAELTNTTDIFFAPLRMLLPGTAHNAPAATEF